MSEIKDELQEIGPYLSKVKKFCPGVDALYFNKMQEEVMLQAKFGLEKNKMLTNSAYFDRMQNEVFAKISSEKIIKISPFTRYKWSIAASVLMVMAATWFLATPHFRPIEDQNSEISLTEEEINFYLDQNAMQYEVKELINDQFSDSEQSNDVKELEIIEDKMIDELEERDIEILEEMI